MGAAFDLLLWQHTPGFGLTIFLLGVLAGVHVVARWHRLQPDASTHAITAGAMLLSVAVSVRSDPATLAVRPRSRRAR